MNIRKRAVSIRMSGADIGSVKKIAKRLGVRDSDVIRCAVKMMMNKLGPLADTAVRGRGLVPVFVESGQEIFRHFDLDAMRLETIINDGVPEESQVDHDDIQLLAMSGIQRPYIKLRLSSLGTATTQGWSQSQGSHGPLNGHALNGHAANGHATNGHAANGHATNGHVPGRSSHSGLHVIDADGERDNAEPVDESLRQYLYDKYVFRSQSIAATDVRKEV